MKKKKLHYIKKKVLLAWCLLAVLSVPVYAEEQTAQIHPPGETAQIQPPQTDASIPAGQRQQEEGQISAPASSGSSVMTVSLRSLDAYEAGAILSPVILDMNNPGIYFTQREIQVGDAVYERINGKSYRDNPDIALSQLRYLKMLHYNFDGAIQVGEMIVNEAIAADVLVIFQKLFAYRYQIQSMYLVDNYLAGISQEFFPLRRHKNSPIGSPEDLNSDFFLKILDGSGQTRLRNKQQTGSLRPRMGSRHCNGRF